MDDVYELYRRGTGCSRPATTTRRRSRCPGPRPRPDKTSIREALGRALFGAQRYEQAAREFEAVIERAPTNDFALFCLGRSLQMLGRHAEARKPLALAACLQPGRRDYRLYRDRAGRAARSGSARRAERSPPARRPRRAGTRLRCYPETQLSHRALGRWQYRKWALARFFYGFIGGDREHSRLRSRARLADSEPDVEVLLAEVARAPRCVCSSIIRMA